MPNYLHLESFFVHGETFNQQEPMIFWQFAGVGGSCVNFHVDTFRLHTHFWSNLNSQLELIKVVLMGRDNIVPFLFEIFCLGENVAREP